MKTQINHFDASGNAFLQIESGSLDDFSLGDSVDIIIGKKTLRNIPYHSGLYCKMFDTVLVHVNEKIYFAIRHGNAMREYGLHIGEEIFIRLNKRKYYWEKENAYSFEEKEDRTQYADEESFANFRPLFDGKLAFYRSSSPFDDAYHRAFSVQQCVEKYGIKTIINMADTEDDFAKIFGALNDESRDILNMCDIYPIGDDSGLYSHEFEESILKAMRIVIDAKTPCLIHCRAGKRRSGFVCAILQALYGMDDYEITADYMVSYKNNNGVTYEDNPARYDYLRDDTIKKILIHINGKNLDNLFNTTKSYLARIGLTDLEISTLIAKLYQ